MRKIKPSKELLMKAMYTGVAQFQGDSDVDEFTLVYRLIPPEKHIQYNPNPYAGNPEEIVCFSLNRNEWEKISTDKEFLGVVKR